MKIQSCPDDPTLQSLLLGKLPADQAQALGEHLLQCDQCATRAETLDTADELIEDIRSPDFEPIDSEILTKIIERGKQLKSQIETVQSQETVAVDQREMQEEHPLKTAASPKFDSEQINFLKPPEAEDELGRLGGYRILKVMGVGGMGVVFLAEDPKLKRQVALKAMKPAVAASHDAKERFLLEARATAAIEHDNIVSIYQVGEDDGIPFIAMRYLQGESLQTKLSREEKLAPLEVARIGKQVALGLAEAHEKGLIHRDIKPDNIWLQQKTNRVKILDFGLARLHNEDTALTQTGMVLGTPKYMAPEQAKGEMVDHRCDLFSLGSVLYHLVSGQAPFTAKNVTGTLIKVSQADCIPIGELCPQLDAELAALITRLLSLDPHGRPANGAEVVQALESIETRLNLAIQNAALSEVSRKPPRSRLLTFMGGLAVIILIAGIIYRIQTNKGTITVELADESIAAKLTTSGVIIEDGDREWTINIGDSNNLPAGETYLARLPNGSGLMLAVTDDTGTELDTKKFQIRRNGSVLVKVTASAPAVAATAAKAESASTSGDNWALEFDGEDDYVVIPSWIPNVNHPVTLEAKVRLSSEPEQKHRLAIRAGVLRLERHSGSKQWNACGRINETQTLQHSTTASEEDGVGSTVFLAAVYDSKTITLFVNGKRMPDAGRNLFDAETQTTLTAPDGPRKLIGYAIKHTQLSSSSEVFHGIIDEVRISNVARYTEDFTPEKRFENDEHTLALYHFDEASGDVLKDSSGNGHHGKIHGAKWVRVDDELNVIDEPPQNYALEFDGDDDFVAVPLDYRGTSPITLEATVRVENEDGKWGKIVSTVCLSLQKINTHGWQALARDSEGEYRKTGVVEYNNEKTVHVATVWDMAELRLYVDGKLCGSSPPIKSLFADQSLETAFKLGGIPNLEEYSSFLKGIIDEVRISNVARYTEDYQPQSRLEADEHTLALYHFDEGSGDVLQDSSGNGHHGKIVGAKWVRVDDELNVVNDGQPATPVDSYARDREAAEWVLSVGGTVLVCSPDGKGAWAQINEVSSLPESPFQLMEAHLTDVEISNDDLIRLNDLPSLRALYLTDSNANIRGLQRLSGCPRLRALRIVGCEIRTSQLGDLNILSRLRLLHLHPGQIDDWSFLAHAPSLQDLFLYEDGTDKAMLFDKLDDVRQLRHLWLFFDGLTPQAKEVLNRVVALNSNLRVNTGAWAHPDDPYSEPIARLTSQGWTLRGKGYASAPEWEATPSHSHALEHLFRLDTLVAPLSHTVTSEECEAVAAIQVSTVAAAGLSNANQFAQALQNSQADFGMIDVSGSDLADTGLATLGKTLVSVLDVRGTQVSESGLAAFHLAAPDCLVISDFGEIERERLPVHDRSERNPPIIYNWPEDQPAPAIAPFTPEEAKQFQEEWAKHLDVPVEYENSIGMKFRLIPPGEFVMGLKEDFEQSLRANDYWKRAVPASLPRRHIFLTKPFFLGTQEIAFAQFEKFVSDTQYKTIAETSGGAIVIDRNSNWSWRSPGTSQPAADDPVSQISWSDAVAFCDWLSQKDGIRYTLPREVQWEFACSAGSTTGFNNNVNSREELAAFAHLSTGAPHQDLKPAAVGRRRANAFGLHDMHGNMWEWCHDLWSPNHERRATIDPTGPDEGWSHVLKGGAFDCPHWNAFSATRMTAGNDAPAWTFGFRVAVSVDAIKQRLIEKAETPSTTQNGTRHSGPPDVAPSKKSSAASATGQTRINHSTAPELYESEFDVLLLGDGHMERWDSTGIDAKDSVFDGLDVRNGGQGGEWTSGLLKKINPDFRKDESPRLIILQIGIAGLEELEVSTAASEYASLLKALQTRFPVSKFVLTSVLPAEHHPEIREKAILLNASIAMLANGTTIHWIDLESAFVDRDKKIRRDLISDGLRLTEEGYKIWAGEMKPLVNRLLSSPTSDDDTSKK